MTGRRRSSRTGQNFVIGSGNFMGDITGSQVTSQVGDQNLAVNSQPPSGDPLLESLREELARIRLLLEQIHDPASSADRDDAIEAVTGLETEVISAQESQAGAPTNFRMRVKALIGVLAPVAEIVGGVAALEAILQRL